MITKDTTLELEVLKEIEVYKPLLDIELKLDKPFSYLSLIAEKYGVSEGLVFNKSLDLFSFYKSNFDISSKQAIYDSIIETHYLVATRKFD